MRDMVDELRRTFDRDHVRRDEAEREALYNEGLKLRPGPTPQTRLLGHMIYRAKNTLNCG